MSALQEISTEIQAHTQAHKALEGRLKKVVTDTSIPLEDRWDLFVQSGMGDHEPWIQHFEALKDYEDDLYDGLERHSTVEITELLIHLGELEFESQHAKIHVTDAFKEEVLSQFIRAFTYDW
jgi:hypothetical protein